MFKVEKKKVVDCACILFVGTVQFGLRMNLFLRFSLSHAYGIRRNPLGVNYGPQPTIAIVQAAGSYSPPRTLDQMHLSGSMLLLLHIAPHCPNNIFFASGIQRDEI